MANQDKISEAKSKVLLISFGIKEGGVKWLDEMKCNYDMLLDQERKVYLSFGLNRSVSKVWSVSCLVYYGEQMSQGRDLPKPYQRIHDDPIQMGGDFIVDKEGKMKLVYCSKASNDRPNEQEVIKILQTRDKHFQEKIHVSNPTDCSAPDTANGDGQCHVEYSGIRFPSV